MKKAKYTANGFTPEFEEAVLNASLEKEEVGPFHSAKEAIAALHHV